MITEHKRPIAEVVAYRSREDLVEPAPGAFTLAGSSPSAPVRGVWEALLRAERDEH